MAIRLRKCRSCHKHYQHYIGAAIPDYALCSDCLGHTLVITDAVPVDGADEHG